MKRETILNEPPEKFYTKKTPGKIQLQKLHAPNQYLHLAP